jgi:hypothetical protein
MFGQTLAIARNTFFESIRQPIVLVLLVVATLGLIFSNLLAGFTMEDDQRMMIDLGLSTVFICGTLLAAFIATNILNREIENRTALTVISKPVGRPLFVLGKYLGVAAAILLACLYMCLVMALVEMHGVLQTVRQPAHKPVLVFGVMAGLLGLGASIWCNYFYGRVFASTVVAITTPLAAVAYFLSLLFDHDFNRQAIAAGFHGQLWLAMSAVTMAVLVLAAIAIAASTRLGQVMTLAVTIGIFVLGMMSDGIFGRAIHGVEQRWTERARVEGLTREVEEEHVIHLTTGEIERPVETRVVATVPLATMASGLGERIEHGFYRACYAILPNFQMFWYSDALAQKRVIPPRHLGAVMLYGALYIAGALGLAVLLFQRREVG